MPRLPSVTAKNLVRVLEGIGFETVRQRGSHLRLKHADGRTVTVPMHSGKDVGRGLMRKILRDAELTPDEFLELL
jgi:predicted RNA binding protein YcfA (HicA-like mRNA interferase family)